MTTDFLTVKEALIGAAMEAGYSDPEKILELVEGMRPMGAGRVKKFFGSGDSGEPLKGEMYKFKNPYGKEIIAMVTPVTGRVEKFNLWYSETGDFMRSL